MISYEVNDAIVIIAVVLTVRAMVDIGLGLFELMRVMHAIAYTNAVQSIVAQVSDAIGAIICRAHTLIKCIKCIGYNTPKTDDHTCMGRCIGGRALACEGARERARAEEDAVSICNSCGGVNCVDDDCPPKAPIVYVLPPARTPPHTHTFPLARTRSLPLPHAVPRAHIHAHILPHTHDRNFVEMPEITAFSNGQTEHTLEPRAWPDWSDFDIDGSGICVAN